MATNRTDRFSLADLMMIVLICGLFAALIASFQGKKVPGIIGLMVMVVYGWGVFKARRTAIPCRECGRRFIPPRTPLAPVACPRCGQMQRGHVRSYTVSRYASFGLLGLLFVLVIALGIVVNVMVAGGSGSFALILTFSMLIASIALTLLSFFAVSAYRWFYVTRPRDLTCDSCGAIIPQETAFGPAICRYCRPRRLRDDKACEPTEGKPSPNTARPTALTGSGEERNQPAKKPWAGFVLLAIVGMVLAILLHLALSTWLGASGWVGSALSILGIFAAIVVASIALLFSVVFARNRRLKRESSAIAMAREFVNEEGEIVKEGPTTIWYSGSTDPVPMIREQMAITRDRFACLLGAEAVTEPRLRVLCFHDRAAFSRFHARYFVLVDMRRWDGVYLLGTNGLATLCTAEPPCRVPELEITVRSLYASALLDRPRLILLAPSIQVGVNRTVTHGGKGGRLRRLNRKMVAALDGGTAFSTKLFTVESRELVWLMRSQGDHRHFQKLEQFLSQSWSVFEFLCGDQAPEERRSALRRWLQDKRLKTHQAESFREHFGIDFDALLDDWRKWVLDQGIGTYDPPPPHVREALLYRVIPVLRDRQAGRDDRILAIREMGGQGFVLGADALIELLRDGDDIPEEEVVWALSRISGLAWGADPVRWQDWWDSLSPTGLSHVDADHIP